MNDVANVSAIAAASVAGASELTFAALQAELIRYTPVVTGSSKATIDYRSLESAIANSNLAAAQVALARLRRDTQIAGSTTSRPAPPAEPATSAAVSATEMAQSSATPHIDVTV